MAKSIREAARDLTCIVLAAGGSRRLGRAKQLLRAGQTPFLIGTIRAARAVEPGSIVVVLGADHLRLRALLRRRARDVETVRNAAWADGMASSLRAGLAAAPRSARAALILLTDQPLVGRRDLERIVAAWRTAPARPAAAAHSGTLGAPAILPRAMWPDVGRLEGDVGARRLLAGRAAVTAVPIPAAAHDIDTQQDLARLASSDRPLTRRVRASRS